MKPIRTFEVTLSAEHPLGPVQWVGLIYPTNSRASGRRIEIRDTSPAGTILWDSGDQYDLANAVNEMDNWLAAQERAKRAEVSGAKV